MRESKLCQMCAFDNQVCDAISETAKRHGLNARGSVIRGSKGVYKIRFTASPDKKLKA